MKSTSIHRVILLSLVFIHGISVVILKLTLLISVVILQSTQLMLHIYKIVANLGNAREVVSRMELLESGPSVLHDTFIDMLLNLNYVNEHIDEFTSPTHPPTIGRGVMNIQSTTNLGSHNANDISSLDQNDEHIDFDPN